MFEVNLPIVSNNIHYLLNEQRYTIQVSLFGGQNMEKYVKEEILVLG